MVPAIYAAHSYTAHATNQEVRSRTGQPPVTSLVKQFGHIARAEPAQDHARALRASTSRLSEGWRRPRGRPRQSWLRTVEADLKPLNFGLHAACRLRPIVPPGGVSWKQPCSLTGAPLHDEDDDDL